MNSPYNLNNLTFSNTESVLEQLRIKIKEAKLYPSECVCQVENVTINGETRTIRRVSLQDNSYSIGWVVDHDLDHCMICLKPFNSLFFRFRHHCRACGNLVCADCSPYRTRIASISDEEPMSRACLNCFGLKVAVQDPAEFQRKQEALAAEVAQKPLNLEAYRTMRKIVPPNITRTSYQKLATLKIPEPILRRIWNTKILWMICMHKDDILKIHVADLRSRFATTGLDIIEMRAIWYNLPDWSMNPKDFLKEEWRQGFKEKLHFMIQSEIEGSLPPILLRNTVYQGFESLMIFKPDMPLRPLFVGIHSTESKMPPVLEDGRRASIGQESDEEDENGVKITVEYDELAEYLVDDIKEQVITPLMTNGNGDSSKSRANKPEHPELSKGFSFMNYLLLTPNQGHKKDLRASIVDTPPNDSAKFNLSLDRGSIIAEESDIDKELDNWEYDTLDISNEGSASTPTTRIPFSALSPIPVKSSDVSFIKRSSTYPVPPVGLEDDEIEVDRVIMANPNRLSLRFEPSSSDKTLKEWKSPNLTPLSTLPKEDTSITPLKSPTNSMRSLLQRQHTMTRAEINQEEKIDEELDQWKVPAAIEEVLEDMNEGRLDFEDEMPPSGAASSSKSRHSGFLPIKPPRKSTLGAPAVGKPPRLSTSSLSSRRSSAVSEGETSPTTGNKVRSSGAAFMPKKGMSARKITPILEGTDEGAEVTAQAHIEATTTVVDVESEQASFYTENTNSFYREGSTEEHISFYRDESETSRSNTPIDIEDNDDDDACSEEPPIEEHKKPRPISLSVPLAPMEEIKFSTFSPFSIPANTSRVFFSEEDDAEASHISPFKTVGDELSVELRTAKEHMLEFIRKGEAYNARLAALKNADLLTVFATDEASRVMLRCLTRVDDMTQPLQTIRLLVEMFHADVNYRDTRSGNGDTALMLCYNRPDIGRYLMSKGADIFLKNRAGLSSIALTIPKDIFWLIEEYFDSDEESKVFKDADETKMREYISWLFFAGYGKKIEKHIKKGDVSVTAAQATILLGQCSENFSKMREPVETYELLEKLMASAL